MVNVDLLALISGPKLSYACSNMVLMLATVRLLAQETAKVAATPLWPLSDDAVIDVLRAVHELEQAGAVLRARMLGQADLRRLHVSQGFRTTAGWVGSLLRVDPRPAREITKQAAALSRQPVVEQAVLEGRVDLPQAVVIADTVESIPEQLADLDQVGLAEIRDRTREARDTMIGMAERLPAFQLRKVGERILAYVAPELAEQADAAALARQDARNQQRRGITLSLPVDGLVRVSGLLDAEDAATVQAALHPLCKPIAGDERTPPQRRVDALVEVCRIALRTTALPEDGGEPPQVAVTVRFDALTQLLGVGITDTGQRLPAATVRRMACDARIVPVVLGGSGQVLDVGRSRRLATGPLRRALHIRDQGCAFPDCDRPSRWTDAHHITPWSDGGTTSLDNLVLLCRAHHRLIHHPTAGWEIRPGADQRPDFIPPPTVDPRRQPRRNLYHQHQ